MTSITADKILEKLNAQYPHSVDDMNFLKFRNNFELLIMTILSAQTTDTNINGLRDELFLKYPDAKTLASANIEEVEVVIHRAGCYHAKARNIVGTAKRLSEAFDGNVPSTIEELTTLPGVGRKTANIVTNHGFHKIYGIAVDTHVKRLSIRLGLSNNTDPEKIEKDLTSILPKHWWEHVNYLLISHGRNVCTAKNPSCESCVLNNCCPKIGVKPKSNSVVQK